MTPNPPGRAEAPPVSVGPTNPARDQRKGEVPRLWELLRRALGLGTIAPDAGLADVYD